MAAPSLAPSALPAALCGPLPTRLRGSRASAHPCLALRSSALCSGCPAPQRCPGARSPVTAQSNPRRVPLPPIKPVAELFPYGSGFLSVSTVREDGAHPSLPRPPSPAPGAQAGPLGGLAQVGDCHLASRSNGAELGVKLAASAEMVNTACPCGT